MEYTCKPCAFACVRACIFPPQRAVAFIRALSRSPIGPVYQTDVFFGKIGPQGNAYSAVTHQTIGNEANWSRILLAPPHPDRLLSIRSVASRVISRIQAHCGQAPSLAPQAIALWEIAGGSERLATT